MVLLLSGTDSKLCDRAMTPLYTLPAATADQPSQVTNALAFAGGAQYLQMQRPALAVPLKASTGFSAILTFQLDSLPGAGSDAQLLTLQGSSGAAVRVRVSAGAARLEFVAEQAGEGPFVAGSADGAVSAAAVHTAVVRYVKEAGSMEVWVDGVYSTEAAVNSLVRFLIVRACEGLRRRLWHSAPLRALGGCLALDGNY